MGSYCIQEKSKTVFHDPYGPLPSNCYLLHLIFLSPPLLCSRPMELGDTKACQHFSKCGTLGCILSSNGLLSSHFHFSSFTSSGSSPSWSCLVAYLFPRKTDSVKTSIMPFSVVIWYWLLRTVSHFLFCESSCTNYFLSSSPGVKCVLSLCSDQHHGQQQFWWLCSWNK